MVARAQAPRLGAALWVGVAAAGLAGLAWWALVSLSGYMFTVACWGVGFIVGHAVLVGARRGGAGPAIIAAVSTLTSLAVAQYFIDRSLAIRDGWDIPLWSGFTVAREVVVEAVRADLMIAVFWGFAVLAAGYIAASRDRRPIL